MALASYRTRAPGLLLFISKGQKRRLTKRGATVNATTDVLTASTVQRKGILSEKDIARLTRASLIA